VYESKLPKIDNIPYQINTSRSFAQILSLKLIQLNQNYNYNVSLVQVTSALFMQYQTFIIRNSAIADRLHDMFCNQPRLPNMVPFHMLGMVSY